MKPFKTKFPYLLSLSSFNSYGPAWQVLPDFLKGRKYQDVSNVTDTALQKGWNTDQPAFIWVQTKPENLAHFNQFMGGQHMGMKQWHEVYPVHDKIEGLAPEQVFFVDVGGGIGHQSIALRERFPGLENRIIVQDIPATLAHAIQHPGIDILEQDFFEPQAVTGESKCPSTLYT